MVDGGLAAPHPNFGRLLGNRLIREDPDPNLSAPPEVPGDSHPGRLNLAGRDPVGPHCFQSILTEVDGASRTGCAFAAAPEGLAVFSTFWL
jgi:hypothetical protein